VKDFLYRLLLGDLATLARDPLSELCRRSTEKPIVKLRIGRSICHLLSDPEAIKHVLVSNIDRYDKSTAEFREFRFLVGNSILTSTGERWLSQRRIIKPAFNLENLGSYLSVFQHHSALCAERWKSSASCLQLVNASSDFYSITLLSVAEALFGEDLTEYSDFIHSDLAIFMQCMSIRALAPIDLPLWIPSAVNRRLLPSLKRLVNVVLQIINRRRCQLKSIESVQHDKADLLTQLICNHDSLTGQPMTDRQICNEVMTMLMAGNDTTASLLGWIFLLLDDNPDKQEILREEIRLHYNPAGVYDTEQLSSMRWMRAVIQEAMRLYPPLWYFTRRALCDDRIKGYQISKGDTMIICPYALHRDTAYWHEPDSFKPERFLHSTEHLHSTYTYIPFGAGKRSCIGAGFAMYELQTILLNLIHAFEFSIVNREQVQPRLIVTLRTTQDIMMKVRLADCASSGIR